jgi:transposase
MGRAQPRLKYSHSANTLMRVVGLLDATSGRTVTWDCKSVTADRLARYFKQIGGLYPYARKIYLVMDNWPVHFHPKVTDALKGDPRIEVVALPTYAPWLNNIEKLWRWVKQRVSHAHPWCNDFPTFRNQVRAEFERIADGSAELKRYCGLEKLLCL